MCMSALQRVLRQAGTGFVEAEDIDGAVHRVSLLALQGAVPEPGAWLVVHSGYAIDRADAADAEAVAAELRHAAAGSRAGSLSSEPQR